MPDEGRLDADLQRLKLALLREYETAVAEAASRVATWTHARGQTNSPYRASVFQRERGAVYRKPVEGRPADLRNVTLFGLDADGRPVFERVFDEDGHQIWLTVGIYEENDRFFVTYGLDTHDAWAAEVAALEVWDGDRVLSVSSLNALSRAGGVREHYVYDGDRVVEIVESRSTPMADGAYRQSWEVQYGADGRPAALINAGNVEWRRRAGSRVRGQALRAAEDALTAGLGRALTEWSEELPDRVVLVHQDDGSWTDQAVPTIAIPLGGEAAEDPGAWLPAEWAHVDVAPEHARAISEALVALEETGTPEADEARLLLGIVARRVAALVEHRRGIRIQCIVTTRDPENILADIADAT